MPRSIPKSQTVAVLNKTDPSKLTGAQKSRVAQLIANAAQRHLLDERFLTPAQRQTRQTNTRLAQPVVEGSSVTNRDLAQQRKLAEQLKYGQQETALKQDVATRQQMARDTGGFYDSYLAELRQHQANTQAINAQAVAQQQALTGAVGAIQTPPSAAPVPGATPNPQVAQDAQNASALRQALTASFGAMFTGQGAARDTYADTLAHNVGPTQKLSGQIQAAGNVEQARKALIQEAAEKGAFGQQFESQFRTDEAKNVLAREIATGKTEQEQQKINIAAAIASGKTPAAQVATAGAKTAAQEEAKNAAKLGLSVHQYRILGSTERKRRLDALQKTKAGSAADSRYTSGPFAGMLKSDVNALSDSAAQAKVDAYNKGKGPGAKKPKTVEPSTQYKRDFRRRYGIDPVGTPAVNNAKTEISRAQTWLGNLEGSLSERGRLLTTGQAAGKVKDETGKLVANPAVPKMDPLFVRVAMDIKQYGGITAGTAARLHKAGYSTKQLGLKMGGPGNPNIPAGKI